MFKKIIVVLALAMSACSYPKQTIHIPFDYGFRQLGNGVTARPSLETVNVCLEDEDNVYVQNVVQDAVRFWNKNLSPCRPFRLIRNNERCTVRVLSELPNQMAEGSNEASSFRFVLGTTEDVWNVSTGRFVRGNVTVDFEEAVNREQEVGIVAHELGHLLALRDDPGRYMSQLGSVMADPMPRIYRATQEDVQRVQDSIGCYLPQTN